MDRDYGQNKVFRRILDYAKAYKRWIFLSFFLSVITVILSLLLPVLMGRGIDTMLERGELIFPGCIRFFFLCLLLFFSLYFFNGV